MKHFSAVERQNDAFRTIALITMLMSACVLTIYVLQWLHLIPLSPF
jgi:hypothetical protein